jgi:hypothetical protein
MVPNKPTDRLPSALDKASNEERRCKLLCLRNLRRWLVPKGGLDRNTLCNPLNERVTSNSFRRKKLVLLSQIPTILFSLTRARQ